MRITAPIEASTSEARGDSICSFHCLRVGGSGGESKAERLVSLLGEVADGVLSDEVDGCDGDAGCSDLDGEGTVASLAEVAAVGGRACAFPAAFTGGSSSHQIPTLRS